MLKYSQYCLAALVAVSLVACGKTKDEQVQSHSKDVLQEYNSLADQVNAMGIPDTTWPDDKLELYQARLTKMQRLDRELGEISGTHGVHVYGSGHETLLAKLDYLASVRRQKSMMATIFGGVPGHEQEIARRKSDIVINDNARLKLGDPSSMSDRDLARAKELLDLELTDARAIVRGGNFLEVQTYSAMIKQLLEEKKKLG